MTSFNNKTTYIKKLGAGVEGNVELHDLNGKLVAVKNYNLDSYGDISSSALREVNMLQMLKDCPNINQVLDYQIVIDARSTLLRVMMRYHNSDLDTFIRIITFPERVKYFKIITDQLLKTLLNLHYRGIVHRDIKPPNILVDYEYDRGILLSQPVIYLADFGRATRLPCEFEHRNIAFDLPNASLYRAPEILTENKLYNGRSDIWSLAITMIEYLTESIITDPRLEFFEEYDPNVAIIYEILVNLNHPQVPDNYNYNLIKNYKLHDHMNVDKILKEYLSSVNYTLIPKNYITLLTLMLETNPNDRLDVSQLLREIKVCERIIEGPPKSRPLNVEINNYYDQIYQIIDICDMQNLTVYTCIKSISLLERYLANFKVNNLFLTSAACLLLISKFDEDHVIDPVILIQIYSNIFEDYQLRYTEALILKRMNYLLISCDNDDLISRIIELNIPDRKLRYDIIHQTYQLVQNDNQYTGDMFGFELVDYLQISYNDYFLNI